MIPRTSFEDVFPHPINRSVVVLFFVFFCLLPAAKADEQPNIVVFLVDDMGVMDSSVPFLTGPDGTPERHPLNEWYRTPNMERLAERGVRFSNFYAQSVCSPTRASVMTGQNAARHGVTNWIHPSSNNRGKFGPPDWNWSGLGKDDVTLPRLLTRSGYRTIHVGKAHFGPLDHEGAHPKNLGFDVNVGGYVWGRPRSYYGKDHYGNHPKYNNKHHNVPDLEEYHGTDTYLTEALTREAKERVTEAVEAEKPFFLYMSHYAVHAPFQPDPRFIDHYEDASKGDSAGAYASMVEGVDKSLGDLLDLFRKLGVAKETVVFFLGDNGSDAPLGSVHGVASSAPLRGKKGTHYEGGTRVPFITAWAQPDADHALQDQLPVEGGAVQEQVGTIVDLFPTILNLAGVDVPDDHPVDGSDLKPLLTGEPDPSREESFLMHYPHRHRSKYFTSLRLGDWKLIYHYFPEMNPANTRYELFNLAEDPSESENLAGKNKKQLRRMIRAMKERLEAQDAPYPVGSNADKPLKPKLPENVERPSLSERLFRTAHARFAWEDRELLDDEKGGYRLNRVVNGSNALEITDAGSLSLPGDDAPSERDFLEVAGPGGTPAWTVSFWFRTPEVDQGKHQGLFSNNRGLKNYSWQVEMHNGTLRLQSRDKGNPNPALSNAGAQNPKIKPDTWHHVVVRKTGSADVGELYLGTTGSITKMGTIDANPGGLQMFRIGVNRASDGLYRAEFANVTIFRNDSVSVKKLNRVGPFESEEK